MDHFRPQLARRISPASMEVARQAAKEHADMIMARANQEQKAVMQSIIDGEKVASGVACQEIHTYEASFDGPDVIMHRTYRFQNTGKPAFDFRTQLFRIAPSGDVRSV